MKKDSNKNQKVKKNYKPKSCKQCHKTYRPKRIDQKFCNISCSVVGHNEELKFAYSKFGAMATRPPRQLPLCKMCDPSLGHRTQTFKSKYCFDCYNMVRSGLGSRERFEERNKL